MTVHEYSTTDDVDHPPTGADLAISALANDVIIGVSPDASIRDAAAKLDEHQIGLLVLQNESGVVGVISERDVVGAVADGVDLDGPVSTIGSDGSVHWASAGATVADVATEMMQSYVRHILVADDSGAPAGVVSMRDLLAIIVD
ncbi:MAG: CBS domain-containing protein [Acidimicrobiales bacterium]